MDKNFDLLSLGETLLRLSPPGNERIVRGSTFDKQIGGAELNVVSGASLLGLRTGIISKLPDNLIGTFARNQIRFLGVSDDYLVYDKETEARLGIYYYENGAYPRKPSVVYDRKNSSMNNIKETDFPETLFQSTKCFHTTGITLALSESCRRTTIDMMRRFKANGTMISFDVNFRGNLWTGEEARVCIEEILPLVDVFFCSEDTARLTFHKEGTGKEMMESFSKQYDIPIVASTNRIVHSPKCHTFGSTIYEAKNNKFYEEEPYRNIEVIDRIGSGDAYISGVLYGLLKYGDCQKAIEYGNATSSMKNTIPGDLPSSNLEEIERTISEHKGVGANIEMSR